MVQKYVDNSLLTIETTAVQYWNFNGYRCLSYPHGYVTTIVYNPENQCGKPSKPCESMGFRDVEKRSTKKEQRLT